MYWSVHDRIEAGLQNMRDGNFIQMITETD